MARPRRLFFWKWPRDGMSWFMWSSQNYGSRWIIWRVGPLNYHVEVAAPGECYLPNRHAPAPIATVMQLHDEVDEIEGRLFEQVAESFFKRWAPADPYEQAHFHAEFHSLVRRIYRDAQEPLIKQMMQIFSTMPLLSATFRAPTAGQE